MTWLKFKVVNLKNIQCDNNIDPHLMSFHLFTKNHENKMMDVKPTNC